jgi:hypothetical protein
MAELTANPYIDAIWCTPVSQGVNERAYVILAEEFLKSMASYKVGVSLTIHQVS